MNDCPSHHLFWAKVNTAQPGDSVPCWPYKPVGHHLLDVAAVAARYLALNPARLKRESRLTGLDPEQHAALCVLLAGLHDLGKISRPFQAQVPACWPEIVLGPCPANIEPISHWEATAVLLRDESVGAIIRRMLPSFPLDIQIVAAVAGHHGKAPGRDFLDNTGMTGLHRRWIGEACIAAARAICTELVPMLVSDSINEVPPLQSEAFSFSLNGLITLADWVGSDSDAFPFEDPAVPLNEYWPRALGRADAALKAKRLVPMQPKTGPTLAGLSPRAGASPRPMQKVAADVEIGDDPQLILIEDGTGSGKTEAALLIAARMMDAGLGEGLYVALPTMATANAMHGRLEAAMEGLFDQEEGRTASLVLSHGKSRLAATLDRLVAKSESRQGVEETVASRFNTWIGDSRKKAFFADAGAGTIDQAFLAVLPKKHLTLRQYALAGRILVVDEAHACDAYMGEELKVLVELQARLGGSVVILSATLGQTQRLDLIAAFARGKGMKRRELADLGKVPLSLAYPLLTRYAGGSRIAEISVGTAAGFGRKVGVERLADREAAITKAIAAAKAGACVAIVCNAVDSAVAMCETLVETGHPSERLTLFHARFAMGDRLTIEEKVLRAFGPDSTAEMRAGQILVATQVVEQSLDLDFDLMISDLAPIDLLIQRAGRLWRHRRDYRVLAEPVLAVVSPEPDVAADAYWLKDTLGPAAYTYQLPGVLWRGARDLFGKGVLETPADLRSLIESAYRLETDDLPEGLIKAHEESLGKEYAAKQQGLYNTIDLRGGYADMRNPAVDEEIGTRLGEKTVTLRLARRTGDILSPIVRLAGADDAVNWALSEVTVRSGWLAGKGADKDAPLPVSADPALIDVTRSGWPEWERAIVLYEVDPDGRLMTAEEGGLVYDQVLGLIREKADGAD